MLYNVCILSVNVECYFDDVVMFLVELLNFLIWVIGLLEGLVFGM